jgi:epoxyqueuosine reductase QueG
MGLNGKVKKLVESQGGDYYGVADLSPAHDYILQYGGGQAARYPRAVTVGIAIANPVVNLLPDRADRAAAVLYRHTYYDVVNAALDQIALRISGALQRAGYQALPVPASKRTDDERISAVFSHKLAAHLAGLGWIGRSCLLVTPDHGPRVRWVTVLTDAPLRPTGQPMDERCGTCEECKKICPQNAIDGKPFRESEDREARLDVWACDRYFTEMEKSTGLPVCGMCLYICPYGLKAGRRGKESILE